MKRVFGLMLLCVISISASAQEHLTFKGIPMNGHISTFVSKLKNIGFKEIASEDYFALVEGEFGGNDCQVAIYGSKKSKVVHKIAVILDESPSWYSLKSTYNEYKQLLASKYGEGTSFEYFSDPYYEGDGYELGALRNDKCTYATYFDTPNGDIVITIAYVGKPCTTLGYIDEINDNIAEEEEKSLITSDL